MGTIYKILVVIFLVGGLVFARSGKNGFHHAAEPSCARGIGSGISCGQGD